MVLIRVCVVPNCSQRQSQPVLWIEIVCCITNFVIVRLTTLLKYIIMQLQLHINLYGIGGALHAPVSYSYMVQLLVMVSTHSLRPCTLMYRSPDVVHVLGVFH